MSQQPRGCAVFFLSSSIEIYPYSLACNNIQICTILTWHDTRRTLHFLACCAVLPHDPCQTSCRRHDNFYARSRGLSEKERDRLEPALLVLVYSPSVSFPSCHLLVLAVTRGIHIATGHAIDGAQSHGEAADSTTRREFLPKAGRLSPGCQEDIQSAPGGGHASAVYSEAGDV